MFLIIGLLIVTGCVLGGYMGLGGKLSILWQPLELVIIGGAGVGALPFAGIIKRAILSACTSTVSSISCPSISTSVGLCAKR